MKTPQFKDLEGKYMQWHIIPGFVIASWLVSLLGTWTTVELLHRRTAGRGWYNFILLLGGCVTMGGIATWSMHIIGNRAIVLGHGQKELQVVYDPMWTAMSFILPVSVTFIAFVTCGTNDKLTTRMLGARTFFGGMFAGISICGMHYVGQMGIKNYRWHVGAPYIAGSALIAIVSCVIALKVFFLLRVTWVNSWWKRIICALTLALAVSGMHWVTSAGTTYRFKHVVSSDGNFHLSRDFTVYVVLALSLLACIGLLGFALKGCHDTRKVEDRAQKVVLASVTFDTEGRLLVTPEGTLPCQKITDSYVERSLDDVFSIAHPVFLWIYRAARNWTAIGPLISTMRIHLNATHLVKRPLGVTGARFGNEVAPREVDYATIFRELFCVAAWELAGKMKEKLDNIGVLYEDIMMTGTTARIISNRSANQETSSDIELGAGVQPLILGRGQLLFLVRRVDHIDAARLKAAGFRFAILDRVMDHLASSTQTNRTEIEPRIRSMLEYVNTDPYLMPGIYLSCCAIRPRPRGHWEVLTRKGKPAQLPSLPVCSEWTRMHKSFLSTMDGWSLSRCIRWLSIKTDFKSATERDFIRKLRGAMEYLANVVPEPWIYDTALTADVVAAPSSIQAAPAILIVFRKLVDIHVAAWSPQLVFSPLNFFQTQQRVAPGSPDHLIFARDTRGEFIRWLRRHSSYSSFTPSLPSIPEPAVISPSTSRQLRPALSWICPSPEYRYNVEQQEIMENAILVRNEDSVDMRRTAKGQSARVTETELEDSNHTESSVGEEEPTFIDELFEMLVKER